MKNLIKAKTKEELADKVKILHGKEIDINFVEDDPVPLKEGKKLLEKLGPKTALQITTARNDIFFQNIIWMNVFQNMWPVKAAVPKLPLQN